MELHAALMFVRLRLVVAGGRDEAGGSGLSGLYLSHAENFTERCALKDNLVKRGRWEVYFSSFTVERNSFFYIFLISSFEDCVSNV